MTISLAPVSPRYSVSDAEDPFKKYWWAILGGFGVTALWLLMPMMGEKAIGSASVDLSKKADSSAAAEQSLGGAVEENDGLSMDGTGRKKKADDGLSGSMLYQALPGEGLEGDPSQATAAGSATKPAGSLAGELKKVAASDGKTAGSWGEKAQRGFSNPKLSGSGLSGMGSASGGSATSASGMSGFGSKNANVGFGATKNVADAGDPSAAASKGIAALKSAAAAAQAAAGNRSNDGSVAGLKNAFDGSKGGSSIGGGATGGGAGLYQSLDEAPINLKQADPKLNEKKIEPPAGTNLAQSDMDNSQFAKQLAMMMVGTIIGGAIGGPAGGIVTSVITKAVEAQEANERKKRELNDKIALENAKHKMGGG